MREEKAEENEGGEKQRRKRNCRGKLITWRMKKANKRKKRG